MPSMSEGRNRSLDRLSGFCHQVPNMYTAMPTAFGMLPWQQATHPQQYAYPMPFPVVMPQINPHPQWSFPVDNFASLPPKAKIENGDCSSPIQEPVVKPARRYSDPGPILSDEEREKLESNVNAKTKEETPQPEEDVFYCETQLFAEEARKDRLFSSLLQELRTARNLNRQLCLELHKAKMQLQLMQQQNNDQQPGSVAAMVRKLYEAHQVRSEVLNHWNKPEDPFQSYRRNSYSSKLDPNEESEHILMKERELLMSRLQSNEKKMHLLRNAQVQWNGAAMDSLGSYYQKAAAAAASDLRPPVNSRCLDDVLSSSSIKLSRSHSFALTTSDPSTSDPPSLDDLDIISHHHHLQHASKHGGTCSLTSSAALLPNPHRAHHEAGRAAPAGNYSSHSLGSPMLPPGAAAAALSSTSHTVAAMASNDSMKRDLEHQLAIVERDRRQLELELRDTLGARRTSEDRVTKLERLVSVLRRKLETQTPSVIDPKSTSLNSVNGPNTSSIPPSPVANNHRQHQQLQRSPLPGGGGTIPSSPSIGSSSSPPLPSAEFRSSANGSPAFRAAHLSHVDGPASLPSYLQVVGPITQL